MLYDGALAALTRATQALDPGATEADPESANRELQRAQDILTELRVTLDVARGGQIAANLAALYDFCLEQLLDANIRKDASELPAVRSVVAGLRDAWATACCAAPVGG
jgi:flagellar secretion chaperone FliS